MRQFTRTVATLDGDAADQAFAGRGYLHRMYVHNDDNATRWVHIYDAVNADVDPTTDAGDYLYSVPADTAITIDLDFVVNDGCVICASSTAAADGTASTALSFVLSWDV